MDFLEGNRGVFLHPGKVAAEGAAPVADGFAGVNEDAQYDPAFCLDGMNRRIEGYNGYT